MTQKRNTALILASAHPALRRISVILQRLGYVGYVGLASMLMAELRGFEPLVYFFLAWPLAWVLQIVSYFQREPDGGRSSVEQRIMRTYEIYEILVQFNPWLLVQSVRQLIGRSTAAGSGLMVDDAAAFEPKVDYILPFSGKWHVLNGGITRETSHSWDISSQRYAYDFLLKDTSGSTYRGKGDRLEDFYCYGVDLLSPGDGIVQYVHDGMRDYPLAGGGRIDVFARDIRGNHVLIRHAENEYSLLAHLKRGSIRVRKGDRVAAGQPIAQCGNSGLSTEPHLHFQVQNTPSFYAAVGLPVRFLRYTESGPHGTVYKDQGYLERGVDCEAFSK